MSPEGLTPAELMTRVEDWIEDEVALLVTESGDRWRAQTTSQWQRKGLQSGLMLKQEITVWMNFAGKMSCTIS